MEQQDHQLAIARHYGYIENDEVWLKPFMQLPARKVGQVKESADASLLYFKNRFEIFRGKVEDLLQKIEESENKGSFLMKALHLKEQVATYDALGDFESLHQRLTEAEEAIKVTVAHNREKNLATKLNLILQVEALQNALDWATAGDELQELRQAWIKTGPVDKHQTEELENRFRVAADKFFTRRKAFQNAKKAMASRAVDQFRALIRQSEALQDSVEFEATTAKLKQLQQDWKEIGGSLPRKQANDLWTQFRAAHNHFFERLKVHIESKRGDSRDSSPDDNLMRKRALVAEAMELLNRPMSEAVARAKELQAAWKQVGPVRGPESDRVWEQFILACDRVFGSSALEHYIRKRPENATAKPEQQVTMRVQALRDFIKYDQQERQTLADNLDKLSEAPANDTFRQMLQGKIRAFERKIRTKNDLIEMLRQRLVT